MQAHFEIRTDMLKKTFFKYYFLARSTCIYEKENRGKFFTRILKKTKISIFENDSIRKKKWELMF